MTTALTPFHSSTAAATGGHIVSAPHSQSAHQVLAERHGLLAVAGSASSEEESGK